MQMKFWRAIAQAQDWRDPGRLREQRYQLPCSVLKDPRVTPWTKSPLPGHQDPSLPQVWWTQVSHERVPLLPSTSCLFTDSKSAQICLLPKTSLKPPNQHLGSSGSYFPKRGKKCESPGRVCSQLRCSIANRCPFWGLSRAVYFALFCFAFLLSLSKIAPKCSTQVLAGVPERDHNDTPK